MPQGILKNFARSKEIPNFVDITPRPIFWPCLNDTLKTESTRHPPGCASFFLTFFYCGLHRNHYICAVAITTPATSHLSTPQNAFHHEKILSFAPSSRRCHRRFRPNAAGTSPAQQKLSAAYAALLQQPGDTARQKAFFDAFPRSFFELEVLFGYNPELIPSNLYTEGHNYSTAFWTRLPAVPLDQRADRLIDLLTGGEWEGDMPNYLKSELKAFADKEPLALFRLLSHRPQPVQRLFWQCYWQNPNNDPWLAAALSHYKKAAARKYPRETAVMESAYREFAGTVGGR